MAEDEVVRDFKKQLSRTGPQLGPAAGSAGGTSVPMVTSSRSYPDLRGELLFPELGRAGDIAQPGGFRREHLLREGPNPAAEQPLLSTLLDPRLQRYFYKSELPESESSVTMVEPPGASDLSTVLVILKSTVGGTLIIIPGAFSTTGLLLAPLILLFVGGVEIYCMVLLVKCVRSLGGGSYGEIASRSMGSLGMWLVDLSILFSQIGFVCSEMLYVAKNCSGAIAAYGVKSPIFSETSILLLQLLVTIPMSWIQKLKYFQVSNIIANTIVLLALAILLAYSVSGLAREGPGVGLESVGPDWMIFAGNVVFSFECINFVIPMYEAHEKKETFAPILAYTLLGVCALFIVFGGVNYAYYGVETRPFVTLNLPSNSRIGRVLPFAFALASLFNVPLFLFPAAIYLESQFFNYPPSCTRTWKINGMRTFLILLCTFVAYLGKNQIGAFVAFIGSFCCVPLAFIFPVICHAKICQPTRQILALNFAVLLLGMVLFVYTSFSSIKQLSALG
eukprot:Skav218883  [mRNA]  locus=scaffold2503:142024:143538:+ [translate_table: standard]